MDGAASARSRAGGARQDVETRRPRPLLGNVVSIPFMHR